MTYTCPVCDYDGLEEAPNYTYEICPCCGTEFGYDLAHSYNQLRARWIALGKPWWSNYVPAPEGYQTEDREIRTLAYGVLWMICCFAAFVPALGVLIGISITAAVGVVALLVATVQVWQDVYAIRSMPHL